MAEELQGDTGKGPFPQFEPCPKAGDFECKYADSEGNCVFENCLYETAGMPKTNVLHFTTCEYCKVDYAIEPQANKIHICPSCLKRIRRLETLPMACVACGTMISEPQEDNIFTGLCPTCVQNWRDLIKDEHHSKLTRCYGCKQCPM